MTAAQRTSIFPHVPLSNAYARLEPLDESHRENLRSAGASPQIWRWQPFNIADGFDAYFDWLRNEQEAGRWLPYVVVDSSGRVVGQTCYLDIRLADRGIEIGGTWYSPIAQGTRVNPAAKLLLIDHAFASGIVRVQLKTDVLNARSRAAIEKLGARYEGALRKHRQRPDGTWRDTVYYSILDDEWPSLRQRLMQRLV
jgi:RimJ/RimL family protein N-acetyltransferase